MARREDIQNRRNDYADYTDAELIHTTYQFTEFTAQNIAAQQLLAERREFREEQRNQKIEKRLNELKKPHWSVVPTFWLTFLGAVSAALAAWFSWLALKR
jgi:hypothetical protein